MNRIILSFIFIISAIFVSTAQEMRIESMELVPLDVSASRHVRTDLNGDACALVKVSLPEGAVFEGNVIAPSEYRTGEYWVYMVPGSRQLMVKHPSAKPLYVEFADYGVEPLLSKATYRLDVIMPAASGPVKQQVEINFTPASAIVLIDGQIVKTANGRATATLAADRDYSYTVTSEGYIGQQGTFHLHPAAPTRLNIQLSPDPGAQSAATPSASKIVPQTTVPSRTTAEIRKEADKAYDDGYYNRAMELYLQIPDTPGAQFVIGYMYQYGKGVPQDYAEAARWYRKAAEQGNAKSQHNLGYMYDKGQGVPQDYAEAVRWYRKAAEQGNAKSQHNLGYMYQYGQGVPQDYAEAMRWYRKAAEQGHASAQLNLGYMYDKGQGVSQDYAEALRWYRKAAEQGNAQAQHNLGYMYQYGQGVAQDYAEAMRWYRKAVEQGNAKSQHNLGVMYYYGHGVLQDYAEAARWYRKSAEQRYASAQYILGYMYYYGQGVSVDKREAYRLIKAAADQGHETSIKFLQEHTF